MAELLPTPNTMDSLPRRSDEALARSRTRGGASNLKDADMVRNPQQQIDWGKFAPAITRWESIIGRPAPAPTKPDGKDGAHRLSSLFTEWMMGLPEGWITGHGLSRNDELKMAGNGVVPQQAELALRMLLDGVSLERERERENDLMPTPTVMDQREGKHLRSIAIENLANGKNRGINLNHLVEVIGVDWNEGDTFNVVDGELKKNDG